MKNLVKIKTKNKKRVGRGIAAGKGKTAGRGTKGQRSRSGHRKAAPGFEGGQTPLKLRLPKKKGFKSKKADLYELSLDFLDKNFKDKEKITTEKLRKIEKLRIRTRNPKFKILASGDTKKRFYFDENFLFTKKAAKVKLHSESKKIANKQKS